MTEEELYNRYHEIQSTYVEIKFVDGEPDEASIYVGCYELFASEISEIVEIS